MALGVCGLLVFGIARGSASVGAAVVSLGFACLTIALFAYRTEVESTEIRVRYLPFLTKRTPMRDVTHMVEEKTLVLVTATSKITVMGLIA